MKDLFFLNPEIIYLNHGSFGAAPRLVIQFRQDLERELASQPVEFLQRKLYPLLEDARASLGDYLNAAPDSLALVPNATTGVNIVARSLKLNPGDEILTTSHEYGACENILAFVCQKTSARLVVRDIPLPRPADEEIVERIWKGVSDRTRFIFLSHLSSPTATLFPVKEIVSRARRAGIRVMVDGAHAPGQVAVDLGDLDPDFYTGNCHKWMLSPIGSAFLYTRPARQPEIEPLVVSWGWGQGLEISAGSEYLDNLQWWGTYDPTPVLSIPQAIEFMAAHDWGGVKSGCQSRFRPGEEHSRWLP